MTSDERDIEPEVAAKMADLRAAEGDMLWDAIYSKWRDSWLATRDRIDHKVNDEQAAAHLVHFRIEELEAVLRHFSAHEVQDLAEATLHNASTVSMRFALHRNRNSAWSAQALEVTHISLNFEADEEFEYDAYTLNTALTIGVTLPVSGSHHFHPNIFCFRADVARTDTQDDPPAAWEGIDPDYLFEGPTASQPAEETTESVTDVDFNANLGSPCPGVTSALTEVACQDVSTRPLQVALRRTPNFRYEWNKFPGLADIPPHVQPTLSRLEADLLAFEASLEGKWSNEMGSFGEVWRNRFGRHELKIEHVALSWSPQGEGNVTSLAVGDMSIFLRVPENSTPTRFAWLDSGRTKPTVDAVQLVMRGDSSGTAGLWVQSFTNQLPMLRMNLPRTTAFFRLHLQAEFRTAGIVRPLLSTTAEADSAPFTLTPTFDIRVASPLLGFHGQGDDIPF